MAWALVFDTNQYAQLDTPIMLAGDFDLEIKFKVYATAGATSVVLSTQSDGAQWIGRWSTTRHLAFWNGQVNFVEGFQVDTDYTYRLVRTGSSVEWFINGVSELTFTNGTTLTIPAFGKLGGASNNLFGQIEYMTIAGVSNYDATNSSHAPGTPILTDFVSGNNATGVNMPTDGSAWLDLGGGGVIDVDAESQSYSASFFDAGISLTGEVSIPANSQSYSLTFYDATVDFTGEVLVNAESQQYSATFYDAQISLVSGIEVQASYQQYETTFYDASVQLSGVIEIGAGISQFNVEFFDASISISDVWTDKPKVTTNWSNKAKASTVWTDK